MPLARFNSFPAASDSVRSIPHLSGEYSDRPMEVVNNMMMQARFMPKMPPKRSMRAPRMRWTSTLHARFVHAVELLGGHESMLLFSFEI